VQTTVNGTPIEALVDSGASVSLMSEKAFNTVWEHWKMQCLPLPAALTVSGVSGEKIDVTGYVEIPLQMEDGKPGEVRTFTRLLLVLSGIKQTNLILDYDFIQEEGMIIDGAANETYFAERRTEGGDTWRSASLCCLRRTTILPKTITHAVVGTVMQLGDRVQEGVVGLCTAIQGSALRIWDSACTVDEHGQVVVAIVNMTNDEFKLLSGDYVGSMLN
jgi:dUTPase